MSDKTKSKTLEEWIEFYNRKCPVPFKRDERSQLFYRPDKGFCEIFKTKDMIVLLQCAGDIKFWRHVAEKICKIEKLPSMGTFVRRHIKPFIRAGGFFIVKTESTKIGERYFFRDKKTRQTGQASPVGLENNILVYFFTWQI